MKSGWPGVSIEVDRKVADGERGNRGLDRDAALALEREGVGLGGALVDAADPLDRAAEVEQTLGEGGLTGVDVGEDAEVQGAPWGVMPSVVVELTCWNDMTASIALPF